jgi:hypothetical protein
MPPKTNASIPAVVLFEVIFASKNHYKSENIGEYFIYE